MSTLFGSTTIIEGVGDEVVFFFGASLLVILIILAWSSTSVTEHGVFRAAILVIERRRQSDNEATSSDTLRATVAPVVSDDGNQSVQTAPTCSLSESPGSGSDPPINVPGPTSAAAAHSDSSTTVHVKADDDVSGYVPTNAGDVLGSADLREGSLEHDSEQVRHRTKTSAEASDEVTHNESSSPESTVTYVPSEGHIKVRLKFLNDTQKLVEAHLADRLGHFRRRHFGEELENNKIVRLIFNGQLLQSDQETLLHYGLFNNCVVHCHISTNIAPPPATTFTPHVELDLSRLMLPLFGLILGLIWCCRIQYRQYFNATSTFALLCITGLFIVSVVALCMPTRTAVHTERHATFLDENASAQQGAN